MDVIYERINRSLEPVVDVIARTAGDVNAEWPGVMMEFTNACVAQNLLVDLNVNDIRDNISTMSSDLNAVLPINFRVKQRYYYPNN